MAYRMKAMRPSLGNIREFTKPAPAMVRGGRFKPVAEGSVPHPAGSQSSNQFLRLESPTRTVVSVTPSLFLSTF